MSKLFRDEVIKYRQKDSTSGDVALPNTFSLKVLILISITLIISIFSFLIFGSYTERSTVIGYLTPLNGVVRVSSAFAGTVQSIQVESGNLINKGDTLMEIISETYTDSGNYYQNIQDNMEEQLANAHNQESLIKLNHNERLKELASNEIQLKERLIVNKRMQENTEYQIKLLRVTHEKYLSITVEGAISQLEIRKVETEILQLENSLYQLKEEASLIKKELKNISSTSKRIEIEKNKELNDVYYKIASIEKSLLDIDSDKVRVVKSPIKGEVALLNVYESQKVTPSQLLLSIIPSDDKLKVSLFVPPSDIGFIKIGSDVSIRYDAYPYQKYGQAKGKIKSISKTTIHPSEISDISSVDIPSNKTNPSFYLVDVDIENQYITIDGSEKKLNSGITVTADIKLENRKLYQWLLEPLFSLKERNK